MASLNIVIVRKLVGVKVRTKFQPKVGFTIRHLGISSQNLIFNTIEKYLHHSDPTFV